MEHTTNEIFQLPFESSGDKTIDLDPELLD